MAYINALRPYAGRIVLSHGFPLGCPSSRMWPSPRRALWLGAKSLGTEMRLDGDREEIPEVEFVVQRDVVKGSFLKKAEVKAFVTTGEETSNGSFTDLGLEEQLLDRLEEARLKMPTPIQKSAIPEILKAEDCALQSYTGSGKTLAYILPVLTLAIQRAREEWHNESIHLRDKGQLQALVVAPSQELAMQIVRVTEMVLPEDARKAVQQLIGGANIKRQMEALKTKPLIVVGTPGRLAELSRKGSLLSHNCPILVLDEVLQVGPGLFHLCSQVDQLSKMQFRRDMLRVTEHTGKKVSHRQTIVVSATLTPPVISRMSHWAPGAQFVFVGSPAAMRSPRDPLPVQVTSVPKWGWGNKPINAHSNANAAIVHGSMSLPPTIRHGYVVIDERKKVDAIRRAIHAMDVYRVLVFMNFARRTQDVLYKLSARGMDAGTLHGKKSKLERVNTLRKFRNGDLRALVVSDIAARGLDVEECDAVFNVELPSDASHYAHRAGRTGRMGREGWVLSFVERRDLFVIEKLAKQLKIEIPPVEIKSGEVRMIRTPNA